MAEKKFHYFFFKSNQVGVEKCILLKNNSGRSAGFAYIIFDNDSTRKQAIQIYNGAMLDGRKLVISAYDPQLSYRRDGKRKKKQKVTVDPKAASPHRLSDRKLVKGRKPQTSGRGKEQGRGRGRGRGRGVSSSRGRGRGRGVSSSRGRGRGGKRSMSSATSNRKGPPLKKNRKGNREERGKRDSRGRGDNGAKDNGQKQQLGNNFL